jgi:hypothetical protein
MNLNPTDAIVPYSNREFKYDLLYVGASYYPNVEAMNFFLSSIFPEIVANKPDIQLAVAVKFVISSKSIRRSSRILIV